jgi:hypothetical protein
MIPAGGFGTLFAAMVMVMLVFPGDAYLREANSGPHIAKVSRVHEDFIQIVKQFTIRKIGPRDGSPSRHITASSIS